MRCFHTVKYRTEISVLTPRHFVCYVIILSPSAKADHLPNFLENLFVPWYQSSQMLREKLYYKLFKLYLLKNKTKRDFRSLKQKATSFTKHRAATLCDYDTALNFNSVYTDFFEPLFLKMKSMNYIWYLVASMSLHTFKISCSVNICSAHSISLRHRRNFSTVWFLVASLASRDGFKAPYSPLLSLPPSSDIPLGLGGEGWTSDV